MYSNRWCRYTEAAPTEQVEKAMSESWGTIIEGKYKEAETKSKTMKEQRRSAINKLLAAAQESKELHLVANTTPLKFRSDNYLHVDVVYTVHMARACC
ncbi:unnamed protein product [Urochloa humidicola]